MKNSITTLLMIALLATTSFAQDYDDQERRIRSHEYKSIFSRSSKVRGFGALSTKYSEFNQDNSILVGAKAGVIINRHFTVGIAAYGLSSVNKFEGVDLQEELYLYGGYGGLLLGFNVMPKEVIHINFPVLIGAGGFHVTDENYFRDIRNDVEFGDGQSVENSTALVIEPGVELEINITKFFRIALGGSYRMVNGVSLDRNDITDDDLTNWSTHATLKFGKFW